MTIHCISKAEFIFFFLVHPCDKDESPCKNEGVCEKNGDEFVCKCSEDWTGDNCETKGENIFMITNTRTKNSK